MIRNKAVVNEDTSGTVHQLQSEIRRLKQLVERLRSEPNTLYTLTSLSQYTYVHT